MAIAQEAYTNKEIDAEDLSQVQQQRCQIVIYYDIDGTNCATVDEQQTPAEDSNSSTSNGSWGTVLSIVLWIVGILGGGFVILVIIFALKARMQKKNEEEAAATTNATPTPTPTSPAPMPPATPGNNPTTPSTPTS